MAERGNPKGGLTPATQINVPGCSQQFLVFYTPQGDTEKRFSSPLAAATHL